MDPFPHSMCTTLCFSLIASGVSHGIVVTPPTRLAGVDCEPRLFQLRYEMCLRAQPGWLICNSCRTTLVGTLPEMRPLPVVRSSMNVICLGAGRARAHPKHDITQLIPPGSQFSRPLTSYNKDLASIKQLCVRNYPNYHYIFSFSFDCKWDPPRDSGYPTHQTCWC